MKGTPVRVNSCVCLPKSIPKVRDVSAHRKRYTKSTTCTYVIYIYIYTERDAVEGWFCGVHEIVVFKHFLGKLLKYMHSYCY